jgi:hypothetical protein
LFLFGGFVVGGCLFAVVGNVPYDATEEELRTIFGQVGDVTSFR